MKRRIYLIALLTILTSILSIAQQQYVDVVYLKNGGKVIGIIVEQIPNVSIKIETNNGSVLFFKMDEIEKIVKEKTGVTETVPPPPQPIQQVAPSDYGQIQPTYSGKFKRSGIYGAFSAGIQSVKPIKTDTKINGTQQPESKYDTYSGLVVKAQIIFEGEGNLAFLFGGTVDKYANGTMTAYYIGGHIYFTKAQVSPFIYLKAGYGLGSIEDPLSDKKRNFTGPHFAGGIGTKIFVGETWGIFCEAGYKYQSSSADWDIKDSYGRTYNIETTQQIGGFEFLGGIFFYP